MRVTIIGSRVDAPLEHLVELVERAVELCAFEVTEVVSGDARGIDRAAAEWARQRRIPVLTMPARFKYGVTAGLVRNECMLDISEALIAIWDGKSKGTAHTIGVAKDREIDTFVLDMVP
jgi:hypothetical protein